MALYTAYKGILFPDRLRYVQELFSKISIWQRSPTVISRLKEEFYVSVKGCTINRNWIEMTGNFWIAGRFNVCYGWSVPKYHLIQILLCFRGVLAYTSYSRLKKTSLFGTDSCKNRTIIILIYLSTKKNIDVKMIIYSSIANHIAIATSLQNRN